MTTTATTTETTAWTPVTLRELILPNRVWLSPMCQYSADASGVPNEWHLAHYGARAAAGLGMLMVECSGVAPDLRTTPNDLGIWSDEQVEGHRRLADLVRTLGTTPALQVGASGRKGSHGAPWDNSGTRRSIAPDDGGWQPMAPSPLPFAELAQPREMTSADGDRVLADLERAARNADAAGYEALELQGANGYLFHQFLSPLSNMRDDAWGGSFERRVAFPLAMMRALRAGWPAGKPLLLRMPASDLMDGGFTLDEAVEFARRLAAAGVDMVDVESGTLTPKAPRPSEPLHNARFGPVLRAAGLPVAASGGITTARDLAEVVPELIDVAMVGRALLLDPYWALRVRDADPMQTWPKQYHRAF